MLFRSFKQKNVQKILVEIVDMDSFGDVTQLQNTPLESLPERPAVGATVTFGPNSYTIVESEPATREEAGESGHLRLVVRRASGTDDTDDSEQSPPLNTYPTVCTMLPALSDQSKIGIRAYQVNVSDWRQIEFVSRTLSAEIEQTIAGVRGVIDNNEVEGGYIEHFMRDLMPSPLGPNPVPFTAVMEVFAEGREDLDGVAVFGHRNTIEGSFAFRTASLTELYGYQADGNVQALCVGGIGTYEYDSPEVQSIADFCADYDLCLIDWPAAARFDPETEEFFAFFDPPTDFSEVYQEAPL